MSTFEASFADRDRLVISSDTNICFVDIKHGYNKPIDVFKKNVGELLSNILKTGWKFQVDGKKYNVIGIQQAKSICDYIDNESLFYFPQKYNHAGFVLGYIMHYAARVMHRGIYVHDLAKIKQLVSKIHAMNAKYKYIQVEDVLRYTLLWDSQL